MESGIGSDTGCGVGSDTGGDAGSGVGIRRWQPAGWIGLPGWANLALAVYAIGFLEGTGSHVRDILADGAHAYEWAASPVRAFYYVLVVLDPLAVYLAFRARAAVAPLGVAIMAADLSANWYYNWDGIRADPARVLYLTPMSLFGLFVALTGVPVWRVLRRRASGGGAPDIG